MKPLKPKKNSENLSRAKLFIQKDLSWLMGYPGTKGNWHSAPEGQCERQMQLSSGDIKRATYTINKLRGDFPRVLPKLVGDVDLWYTRHQLLINTLKLSVNGKQDLPSSAIEMQPDYRKSARQKALQLKRDVPGLGPLVDAFSWHCWLEPKLFTTAIKWIDGNQENFQHIEGIFGHRVASILLIRIYELKIKHGAGRAAGLIEFLCIESLFDVRTEGGALYLQRLRTHIEQSKKTVPDIGKIESEWKADFLLWIDWLVLQNDRVARAALDLFLLVKDSPNVAEWSYWWDLVRFEKKQFDKSRYTKPKQGELLEKIKDHPHELDARMFFSVLKQFSTISSNELHKAVRSALPDLPTDINSVDNRLEMLLQWNALQFYASRNKRKLLVSIIKEYRNYLASQPGFERGVTPLGVLYPYHTGFAFRYPRYTFSHVLLNDMATTQQIRNFFQCIPILTANKNFKLRSDHDYWITSLARISNSPQLCATALFKLEQSQALNDVEYKQLELSVKLCDGDLEFFLPILKAVSKHYDSKEGRGRIAPQSIHIWSNALGDDVRAAVLDGHLAVLDSTAHKIAVVKNSGGRIKKVFPRQSELEEVLDWIDFYPCELHSSLNQLANVHSDAQSAAARILQKDFLHPAKIKQELKALKKGQSSGKAQHVKARIKKLERWLVQPPVPGARRVKNLDEKLQQAVVREKVNSWESSVSVAYQGYLQRLLKCEALPGWTQREDVPNLLSPFSDLKPAIRKLAIDILINRCNAPPWDMRSRAANKRFLNIMFERNIDMEPWLDNAPVARLEHKDREVVLTLERDSLEVLSMGKHFQTCLSPGDFNYFSVFANAADINKTVLYGRDSKSGRVVARCLLALTDKGEIVKFYSYRHDAEFDFDFFTIEYATRLAKSMNTVLAGRGTVSLLVAPDWYDDGVEDITNRFSSLAHDSVEARLKACELHEVAGILESELTPLQFDELTLPHVFSIDAFDGRPELVLPLFAHVVRNDNLRDSTLIRVLQLLHRCGRSNEIRKLMPRLIRIVLKNEYSHMSSNNAIILALLVSVSAAKVVEILKQTRSKGVRKWSQETDTDRLLVCVMANYQLKRLKTTASLIETMADLSTNKKTKNSFIELSKDIKKGDDLAYVKEVLLEMAVYFETAEIK